jgi:hypothetical protein
MTAKDLLQEYQKENGTNKPFQDYYLWWLRADKKMYKESEQKNNHEHKFESKVDIIKNEFDEEQNGIISQQQASLQSSIVNIQSQVVNNVMNNVENSNGEYTTYTDIISEKDKEKFRKDIELALSAFYMVILPIYAGVIMNRRLKEFGDFGNFKMNKNVRDYVKEVANKTSESHILTILNDLLLTIKDTFDSNVKNRLSAIEIERKVTDADLELARRLALEGKSLENIKNSVKQAYADKISNIRAKAIARTETNRAFTQSQYQADLQFLKQNDLESKAYKKWITTSDNPCPTCLDLASRPPIPFKNNFADLGDEIITTYEEDGKTKVKKNLVNFEPLSAGNAHVNCACKYMLIIE